ALRGRDGGAGQHGVGCVGDDEHGWFVASPHVAVETRRDLDGELHGPGSDELVELIGRAHLALNVEIVGVPHSFERSAAPSRTSTVVGICLGSVLIAKPNSVSCKIGTNSIVAKVMRSRRICTNSLTIMAHMRPMTSGSRAPAAL